MNPHAARRPDASGHRPVFRGQRRVSILIQPEDRMQVGHGLGIAALGVVVTILIQPEDRMQAARRASEAGGRPGFNPHPARRPDARLFGFREVLTHCLLFQSSFSPKTGCKAGLDRGGGGKGKVSILIQPEDRMQAWEPRHNCVNLVLFQSSSSPKTGCKTPGRWKRGSLDSFNPHPARRPDARGSAPPG